MLRTDHFGKKKSFPSHYTGTKLGLIGFNFKPSFCLRERLWSQLEDFSQWTYPHGGCQWRQKCQQPSAWKHIRQMAPLSVQKECGGTGYTTSRTPHSETRSISHSWYHLNKNTQLSSASLSLPAQGLQSWGSLDRRMIPHFFQRQTRIQTYTDQRKPTYLLKGQRPTTVFNHRYKRQLKKKKEYPVKPHTY